MPEQCEVSWNPGVWPYATRCVLNAKHVSETGSDHTDRHGNKLKPQRAEQSQATAGQATSENPRK